MREWKGNLTALPVGQNLFDAICITTNGVVRKDGACVMGAGIAKSFKEMIPSIPFQIGTNIKKYGNRCFVLGDWNNAKLCTFVVKHKWSEPADINLIIQSCHQITAIADKWGLKSVAIPRPGCGNGRLDWNSVKAIIEPLLDDRFIICSF